MEDGDFWNDPVVSQNKMKTLKSMKDDVATYEKLATQFDDIETLIEMGYEENDASLIPEIEEMLSEFVTTFDNIRIKTLLSGEYDGDNAILSLHAGLVEPSRVTGHRCCSACIPNGQTAGDMSWLS